MRALAASVVVALLAGCPTTATPGTSSSSAATKSAPSPKPPADAPAPMELSTGVAVVQTARGPQRFRVELAVKPRERERGLMYREHLDDDAGMVFFFERQQPLSFWMKNTYLPLDMLFIDENLVVKGIVENAEPLTTSSRRIGEPTRFVLELNAGTARRLGLAAGDHVHFEGVPEALWLPPSSTSTAASKESK
jgi:uncharacterized membrane protein (UPF0127 family)